MSDTIVKARAPRPRGYITWNPTEKTRALLDNINAILVQYDELLPLTARQIFYRLVASHGYDKTEQAYNRLAETLNKARRAGLIRFSAIRDDGRNWTRVGGYEDIEHLERVLDYQVRHSSLKPSMGQPYNLMVTCEARGMVPMLERIAEPYGAPVLGTGGFSSVTAVKDLADTILRADAPTVIIQIGDYDPSGLHLYQSFMEDVTAFVEHDGGDVTFKRLTVREEQIVPMGLPTAPPKRSDNRRFDDNRTVQAEAIPPDQLRDMLAGELEDYYDWNVWNEREEEFLGERDRLQIVRN